MKKNQFGGGDWQKEKADKQEDILKMMRLEKV
jgi:hypothetical protein